jgi:hypothetical protein
VPNSINNGDFILARFDGDRCSSIHRRRACALGGAAETSVSGVEAARDVRWKGPVSQDTGASAPIFSIEEELDGDLYSDLRADEGRHKDESQGLTNYDL